MYRHSMFFRGLIVAMAAALIGLSPAYAKPQEGRGNGGNRNSGNSSPINSDSVKAGVAAGVLIAAGISATDARAIAMGQHLTGYSSLPPGIQKNLARGKPLPPGIAKKMVPGGMLQRLPVHPGYEWRVMGSDLVLIATATSIIADVLADVFK